MSDRRLKARLLRDRLARVVITVAGFASTAVLLGIFALLLVRSIGAFHGGVETEPLTPAERAALSPDVVAALDAERRTSPSVAELLEPIWRPDGHPPVYGLLALLAGTALTTVGALVIAVPIGIATAAYLAFAARSRVRDRLKLAVELLAAVPSVVVGFIGLEVVGPLIAPLGAPGGLTALNGALLLAVMALPTVVSLSEDALSAVPRPMIEGALALGADRWQMLVGVALPTARSGLLAASMLGMGRAIGETMTVLMVTGNVSAMPYGLLDPVRTLTATIAIELGEVPRGTTHYLMLFFLGFVLFLVTMGINLVAQRTEARGAG